MCILDTHLLYLTSKVSVLPWGVSITLKSTCMFKGEICFFCPKTKANAHTSFKYLKMRKKKKERAATQPTAHEGFSPSVCRFKQNLSFDSHQNVKLESAYQI